MKNKKLDLKFGAEVKELVVQYQKDSFKSLDGKTYSFEEFTTNREITKLLTQSFRDIQSINSSDRSKKKTNGSIQFGIRKFLKWIETINYQDNFSYKLLLEYKQSLEQENSWTAYSSYAVIIRLVSNLINKGLIAKFIVPKNIPLQQAKNSARTGQTIASTLVNPRTLSNDDINEKVLSLIIDIVWEETFKLFDYLEIGKQWCSEIKNKEYIPYKTGMKKEEALKNIVKNCYIEFQGLPTEYSLSSGFKGYNNISFVKIMNKYMQANKYYNWHIGSDELNKYFYPTKKLASNIVILLVASQINPESAIYLDKNCLHNDINENIVRISWVKNRAGGEQTNMPFPKGKHKQAKTIPNVIERYLSYSSNMHSFIAEKNKNLLFVFRSNTTGKMSSFQTFNSSTIKTITESINLIKESLLKRENSNIVNLTLKSLDKLTLSLIRTTALNIAGKRLNRDISALASMDGRKTEKVLVEHYLNNSETKQAFDSNIRESQELMQSWIYEKPIVIQENQKEITSFLKIDNELAEKIINDEFNNGYGASLINHNVIIIDSPLNALRIMQWLDKINQDEHLVRLNNPERWDTIYASQISLFNEALKLMSKKSKQEAKKLNNEIQLPFPEVL